MISPQKGAIKTMQTILSQNRQKTTVFFVLTTKTILMIKQKSTGGKEPSGSKADGAAPARSLARRGVGVGFWGGDGGRALGWVFWRGFGVGFASCWRITAGVGLFGL